MICRSHTTEPGPAYATQHEFAGTAECLPVVGLDAHVSTGKQKLHQLLPKIEGSCTIEHSANAERIRFLYHRLSVADARRCARGVRLARCASRRSTDRSRSPTRGAAGASRALAETQAARRRTRRGRSLQRSALQWTGVTTAPCGSQAHLTTHATASPRGPCALGCASARKPRRTASRPTESLRSLHRHKPRSNRSVANGATERQRRLRLCEPVAIPMRPNRTGIEHLQSRRVVPVRDVLPRQKRCRPK